jgi:hypothetical protein
MHKEWTQLDQPSYEKLTIFKPQWASKQEACKIKILITTLVCEKQKKISNQPNLKTFKFSPLLKRLMNKR